MTNEQMERAIEFLLDHHAKFSADMDELKNVQRQQTENLNRLTTDVQALTENTSMMQSQIDSIITEMRESFDKLILANEVMKRPGSERRLLIRLSRAPVSIRHHLYIRKRGGFR